MDEIDFDSDSYDDIVAKDPRYNARAYSFLMTMLSAFENRHGRHFSAEDVMSEFREEALDQYGPLAYRVLTEWGVKSCEDIGEMMFNLADHRRIARDENDDRESFIGGYDFEETFRGPFRP